MMQNATHTIRAARTLVLGALLAAALQSQQLARGQQSDTARAKSPNRAAPAAGGATVFFVSQETDAAQIEPIMRVAGSRLAAVPDSGKGALNKQLAGSLYKAGRQYAVIFGGGRAGTLTVKSVPDFECSPASANVALDAQIKLGGNVFALATDGGKLGRPEPSRRAPTAEERAAVGKLVEGLYKQHGVPAARAAAFDTINLTATDLDGDGAAELVGTFKLKRTSATSDMLFVVAEPQGAEFRAGLANYEKVEKSAFEQNPDAFEGVGVAGFLFEVLVDQLDTDGDGTGEIITRNLSFEGVGFNVYKKSQGRWRKAGEFYNYHCAY
jgi:hypothetical protein